MEAEVSIVVVVVIPQQVLHGAFQQAVVQVLLQRDLTHKHTNNELNELMFEPNLLK